MSYCPAISKDMFAREDLTVDGRKKTIPSMRVFVSHPPKFQCYASAAWLGPLHTRIKPSTEAIALDRVQQSNTEIWGDKLYMPTRSDKKPCRK